MLGFELLAKKPVTNSLSVARRLKAGVLIQIMRHGGGTNKIPPHPSPLPVERGEGGDHPGVVVGEIALEVGCIRTQRVNGEGCQPGAEVGINGPTPVWARGRSE